jgi:tape measure domain-containing protein
MEGGDQSVMATIDDKVVAMSFESSKFEQGVSRSISALDKLKSALKLDGATSGLENIDRATQGVQTGLLARIGGAIDNVLPKFDALRLVAIGVMSQITTKAVVAGSQLLKSLTLDPIIQGFHEYTTNLNAVQTIMANTQAAGTTLKDVNAALNQLNHYSDKTIYNFSEMARNIGTFTAAGVDLKTSTEAIKGIANLAALSGSNADQASTAMYQLSQAIAAGQVHLMDWNSVVNAGMGGTVFQRALAETAVAMGTIDAKTVKLTGKMKNVSIAGQSFRNSLSTTGAGGKSWLTSDVLTTTLAEFTGDLTDAQLKAKGFNDEQIKAIQQTAKTAEKAATQVKTLGQLLDTTKESIGSGWAMTWQLIFGDFNQARTLFTGVSEAINGFISTSSKARNKVLKDWAALGGRTALIKSIGNIFKALGEIMKPIKDAFHDIFPAVTGKNLAVLTKRFELFTKSLKPSKEVIDGLHRTFRGFFALLDIGKQILGGIFDVFKRVFGVIAAGTGSFLGITGNIGDFLVKVDEALKKGKGLENFFNGLGDILVVPFKMIEKIRDALATMFDGFSSGGFSGQMGGVSGVLGTIGTAFGKLLDSFAHSDKFFNHAFDALTKFAQTVGPAISKAIGSINWEAILAVVRTGLVGGIFLMVRNFFGSNKLGNLLGGGIINNIKGAFGALQNSMVALQNNIRAKTLKEIAIAIALLAASVVALSLVDPKRLSASLGAMTIAFGELLAAMAILTSVTKSVGFLKLPIIGAALIAFAGAIVILSLAVAILAQLSWDELLKGLTGVGVLLGIIAVSVIPLSLGAGGLIRAGTGLTALAVGLFVLSQAVKQLAQLSWGDMVKGLIGISVGLGILMAAMFLMPKSLVLQGAGLILVAVALDILAGAVKKFGALDWSTMGKGLLGIGAALGVIGVAMRLMPMDTLVIAAGLFIVAVALGKIASVVQTFGGMSISEIAKGIGTLAAALIVLGVALYAMSGTLAGAAALTIAAAGISVLAGSLQTLGSMSWQQIVTSLIALAAAFAIIGIAGALITPAIPGLLGLGAAMLLIGAGLALAGVGIGLIATGLSALVVALPSGIGVLLTALTAFQKGIVDNAKLLVLGVLEIARAFANTAPQFVDALLKILNSLADGLIKFTPKLRDLIQALLDAILKLLDDNQDKIVQAGIDLITALLKGIRDNIAQVVALGVEIINNFLGALGDNASKIVGAGLIAVLKFIEGIANNIQKVVTAGLDMVVKIIKGIGNGYNRIVQAGSDIISHLITGIANSGQRILAAGVAAATKFMNAVANQIPKLANNAASAFIKMLNNMADVIEKREPEVIVAMARVGAAIVKGTVVGIQGGQDEILKAIMDLIPGPIKSVASKVLGIASPSKLTMGYGKAIADGFIIGMRQGMEESNRTAAELGTSAMNSMQRSIQNISNMVSTELEANPTITPILDLTQVRSQAQELSKLTTVSPITAAVSLKQASNISPIVPDAQAVAALGGSAVHFEQNNYSPKALTEVEIYRQTRNQLSQLKTSLALN